MQLFYLCLVHSLMAQKVSVRNGSFSVVYDIGTQCPSLVEWVVCSDDMGNMKREPSWRFLPDVPDIRARARHDDYTNSGYDRGHMCAASDRSASISSMKSTFVMSNVAPQTPRLNRGKWQASERACRKLAIEYDSVHVLAMPIFIQRDTTFIGGHRIAVPHAFLKVAWLPGNDSIIGLWFLWNR